MEIKTIYVSNIPYTAYEDDVLDHFAPYGAHNVRLMEGRGYAFIDIDAEQLETALLEKENSELMGRRVHVTEARPRDNGDGDRRGFNRGGGDRRY